MSRTTRRGFLWVGIAGAASTLVAACSSSSPTQTPPSGSTQSAPTKGAATAQPASQGSASGSIIDLRFGMYASPLWQPTYTARLKAFTTATKIPVTAEWAPYAQWTQKLQTEIASGTLPDVTITDWDDIYDRVAGGVQFALDEYIQSDKVALTSFYPAPLDWAKIGGKIYGLPFNAATAVFYYNKDAFDQAKLSYPDEKWTWDDVLNAAQKLTTKDSSGKVTSWGTVSNTALEFSEELIWSAGGGGLVNDAYTKAVVNQPIAIEKLRFLVDLIRKYKVAPSPVEVQGLGNVFDSGRVAMDPNAPSWDVYSHRNIKKFKWDLTFPPLDPKTKKRITPLFPNFFAGYSKTKSRDESWKLISWLTAPDKNNQSIQGELSYGSVNPINWVPDTDYFLKGQPSRPEHWKVFFQNLGYARDIPHKWGFREWRTKANAEFQAAVTGHKSVRAAADAAAQVIQGIIDKKPANAP